MTRACVCHCPRSLAVEQTEPLFQEPVQGSWVWMRPECVFYQSWLCVGVWADVLQVNASKTGIKLPRSLSLNWQVLLVQETVSLVFSSSEKKKIMIQNSAAYLMVKHCAICIINDWFKCYLSTCMILGSWHCPSKSCGKVTDFFFWRSAERTKRKYTEVLNH